MGCGKRGAGKGLRLPFLSPHRLMRMGKAELSGHRKWLFRGVHRMRIGLQSIAKAV